MKKQLVRIAASTLVALALASATHGTNASADGRAVSPGDGVSQSAGASTLIPSGFVPNPQALLPSQVKFPATRFSAIDLSAHNPPVGDQFGVNSCTAWATGYYLRGWYANRDGYANGLFTAMYTYSQIALAHNDFVTHANSGSSFKENLDIQVSQGIDTAEDYQGILADPVLPTSAQRANAAAYGISDYTDMRNDGGTRFLSWIKSTLASGNPIAIGFPIYPEFVKAAQTNGYVSAPAPGESSSGGHATFAYGYDATGLFIENQWGSGWGNNGYGVLSWDFVQHFAIEAVSVVPPDVPPTWQQVPGGAIDISVGPTGPAGGGEIWVIGMRAVYGGNEIYRWNAFTRTWQLVVGGAVRIAVDTGMAPWVVSSFGEIFRGTDGAWQQMPGAARDIAASSSGSVWSIGWSSRDSLCRPGPCDGGIYRWTGSDWQQLPGMSANRIAVDEWNDPWVVTRAGTIHHWTGSAWQQLPGSAVDIACGSGNTIAAGDCWVTGTDGGIYHWRSTALPWSRVESGAWEAVPGSAVAIAVAPSHNPWVVNGGGAIFEFVH